MASLQMMLGSAKTIVLNAEGDDSYEVASLHALSIEMQSVVCCHN